ncbi:MAG: hypothetical protein ACYTEZ_07095 [Planctomycetota bacterium]|jgi:hypothetical protein
MRVWALLGLAAVAGADSWLPFGTRIYVAPNHRYYLVARENRGRMEFELLERRAAGRPTKRDAGDRLIVKGIAPYQPMDAHVLGGEPAVLLFERYANIGGGDTLARLDRTGQLAWRVKLHDVDRKAFVDAPRSVSSVWWYRTWWVDEPRGAVVLVARNGHLNEVDLQTGEVTVAPKEVVLAALALPWARDDALEVATDLEPAGLRPAVEPLVADAKLPAGVRLRAAVARQQASGPAVPEPLWRAAMDPARPVDERQRLVRFAGRYLALDLLAEAALQADVAYQVALALKERGAAAALAGLVTHGDVDRKVRAYACELLAQLPAEAVLRAVQKELKDAEPPEAGLLLHTAVRLSEDLSEVVREHETTLIAVLDKQTGPLGWLADYFRTHPTTEAVQPLLKALRKHRRDAAMRARIIAALKPCTGLDFGDDPDAWLRGVPR